MIASMSNKVKIRRNALRIPCFFFPVAFGSIVVLFVIVPKLGFLS